MFQHVEFYPGDPILGLVETFNNDSRAEKALKKAQNPKKKKKN